MKNIGGYILLSVLFTVACKTEENPFDSSGTFEAVETIISSEVPGKILSFEVEEGAELAAGQSIGLIDTTVLFLQKKQLQAQIAAVKSRDPNIKAQTSFYDEQMQVVQTKLETLQTEKKRLEKLVAGDAAPKKNLDDINANIAEIEQQKLVIAQQKAAQVSALQTQSTSLKKEPLPLLAQIEQIDDQLAKCRLQNPVSGTVLTKYAQAQEITAPGMPLYKIADLSTIILRAYVTGDQLPTIKLNQMVKVSTDDGVGGFYEDTGRITWISSKSEFTPKTIQTKNERANLVYAIKVTLKNSGRYKIGMYGEIKF